MKGFIVLSFCLCLAFNAFPAEPEVMPLLPKLEKSVQNHSLIPPVLMAAGIAFVAAPLAIADLADNEPLSLLDTGQSSGSDNKIIMPILMAFSITSFYIARQEAPTRDAGQMLTGIGAVFAGMAFVSYYAPAPHSP